MGVELGEAVPIVKDDGGGGGVEENGLSGNGGGSKTEDPEDAPDVEENGAEEDEEDEEDEHGEATTTPDRREDKTDTKCGDVGEEVEVRSLLLSFSSFIFFLSSSLVYSCTTEWEMVAKLGGGGGSGKKEMRCPDDDEHDAEDVVIVEGGRGRGSGKPVVIFSSLGCAGFDSMEVVLVCNVTSHGSPLHCTPVSVVVIVPMEIPSFFFSES